MLSQRLRAMSPSPTVAMDTRAKQLIEQGADVVNMAAGEPDFDTPDVAKQGGIRAIEQGFSKYTPVAGTLELRKAIARKLEQDNGVQYTPDQIVVSNGGKQALYNAFMALVDPGDEVIIPAPYWVTYPEQVKLAGGVPVIIPTDESTGFRVTAEMIRERLTPRTKILVLNSPSNPTGAVYSLPEIEAIAALAVERNLFVFTDEIYEKLCYGSAEHVSIASLGPEIKRLTVTFNGFSKAYAMTGWRMGYSASEPELAKAMSAFQGQCTHGPSSITQKAAVAALQGDQSFIEEMRQAFDQRRLYMLERLRAIKGLRVDVVPEGAFYMFPRVSDLFGATIRGRAIRTADDLAYAILEEAKVALVPGTGFGAPDFIRLSYATSMEQIKEACDRIAALLQEAR